VKNSLLALLCERPHDGYELSQDVRYAHRFDSLAALKIGQVYTTLLSTDPDSAMGRPASRKAGDAEGSKVWARHGRGSRYRSLRAARTASAGRHLPRRRSGDEAG